MAQSGHSRAQFQCPLLGVKRTFGSKADIAEYETNADVSTGNSVMSHLRILVVEDQPDNRQNIRDMLAGTDYEITEAEDGEQALAAVAKARPDVGQVRQPESEASLVICVL